MLFERLSERVYRYSDICNVYVITNGDRAVLIDFGTGSVVEHLDQIGVVHVDWVLHTHHHRDQCQGDGRLAGTETRIVVPAREAHLFEDVESFWQTKNVYDMYDLTNVWNSLTKSVPVSRRLADYDVLSWSDVELLACPTPGHTKGSVSYLAEIDGLGYAFCGDLIYSEGRIWTLYDLQWHYTEPDGLNAALHSVHVLRRRNPDRLAPSHGEVMDEPGRALGALGDNMLALYRMLAESFEVTTQTPLTPAIDTRFSRVSEHLFAAAHPCANFYALRSRSGSVLFFDYGFPSLDHAGGTDFRFVEHSLAELKELFGIDRADVLIPSHYHDDHVCGAHFLQKQFGTEIWAYENFVDILERPEAYRIPCLWPESIPVAKVIAEGETIAWNEYRFEARHNPGHTWYAVSLFGEIDGRGVAVTGDELLLSGIGRLRAGGPMFRNRVRADSFTSSLRTIIDFEPELLLTGHSGAVPVTKADLENAFEWCRQLEGSWRRIVAMPDEIEFALDPDFVSFYPYETRGAPGQSLEFEVELWNHHNHHAGGLLRVVSPDGWTVEPAEHRVSLEPGAVARLPFAVVPAIESALGTRHVLTVDVELGERRFGQAAEALVTLDRMTTSAGVDPEAEEQTPRRLSGVAGQALRAGSWVA